MTHEIEPFQVRAYVREGITRIPIDVQKYEIQKAADKLGLNVEWYIGVKSKLKTIADERDMWAEQLRRDEIGMVHSLPVLRLSGKQLGGADPKSDFSGLMASIDALYLMEASTGITSKDKRKWKRLVTVVTEKPPPGTNALTPKQASKLAKDGWVTRDRGVKYTWISEAREKQHKHLVRHWKAARTQKEAHETLGEFIDDMGGGVYEELRGISEPTLRRIVKKES